MKQINYKKLILPNIPYVFFVYLFDKVGQAVRLAPGADISAKILNITQGFSAAFENALPSVYPLDLLVGIVGAVIIRLIVYVKGKNAKKYRKGAEYGSARWGNAEDIKPYIDPDFQNNIILTQTERLTMNSRPKQPKYARNKNVVVIGGSGSGKTRFFVKPNLMQLHSSYVLTDPKGTVLIECGKLLQRAGYRIKVLNTINFKKSMHYNPFVYIRSEKDILKLVNTLIANTKGEGEKSAEDFWVKAERLLYCALVGYIWYEAPAEEMNFITLLELINASEAREDDEEYQSPVDLLFADLEERDPDHFAVKQYRKYKLAAGKTAKSILISCGARLAPFDIKELRDLMSYDELELDTLGDRKTALFLIMSDTDSTFNFVIAMLQSQLFNLLCDKADDEYGGKLPVHVRCLLDEFANIGQIPQFEKLIATIRSREISASIILQSQSQLKAIYTVEVPYNYYILHVDLENFNLSHVPVYIMGEEQLSMYAMYMSSLGNRPDLFPQSGYVSKYYENPPADYEVPAALLGSDEKFARLMEEADKYVGFPYVWGGSTPETSFDCSGFVSYVLTNSGLYNTGRLGAQGLYNISTPVSNPQPGDLVFFTGTYDTPGVSHVGIYVGEDGDGSPVMLHCGDPIQYSKLDTSYWQSHFNTRIPINLSR